LDRDVFLSVGKTSTPEQEAFVRAIEEHLQANGLVPRTAGRSSFSSSQPLQLVSELMEKCHGTVVVAFERTYIETGAERRGSPEMQAIKGSTLPTVWNQIEAAMAYVHNHPLLVLVEHGTKSEGLLEKGYDWYVQWCQLDRNVLASREFAGVFADWRRRVEEHASQTPNPVGKAEHQETVPDKLTLGQIVGSMTPAQMWAVLSAVAVLLAGVATTAFKLGQYTGIAK
jgi:hypothetical protein